MKTLLSCFLLIWLSTLGAQAAKVVWQSIPNSSHVTSQNVSLDDAASFELGTFAPGFVPSLANRSQWASKWTVLDRTSFNPNTSFFASNVSFDTNDAPFVAGRQAYMWGSSGGANPEWILVTSNNWKWPEATLGFPTVWSILEGTPVTGEINTSGSPFLLRTTPSGGAAGSSLTPDQWLAQHFEPEDLSGEMTTDLSADPDGDGRTNLLEMAIGSDPNIPQVERSVPYNVGWEEVSGFYYLKLTVDKQAIQQVDYRVEVSGDLENWLSGSHYTTTLFEDISTLSVRDNVAFESGVARFIRLTVER